MAVLVLIVLISAMTVHSDAIWCICRNDLSDSVLQKTLDYACGAGADCTPITQNGPCYNPNTVKDHCSYAVNSYFQRKGQVQGSCVFANTATISQTDPSTGGSCVYPSTAGSGGSNGTTPSTSPPSSTTPPTTFTPTTPTPPGFGGGFGSGLAPSQTGFTPNSNGGGLILKKTQVFSVLPVLWFSGLIFFCV